MLRDAFTLRWYRACAAKPIVNPLFGFFDNKLLGKRFRLKANARINNDCMNLELFSELDVNIGCPITDGRVEEHYWQNKMPAYRRSVTVFSLCYSPVALFLLSGSDQEVS